MATGLSCLKKKVNICLKPYQGFADSHKPETVYCIAFENDDLILWYLKIWRNVK